MARPQKKGLDYFPMDVDIFNDTKLKVVRAGYGSDGVMLYLYLLCAIYKNGFYIVCDDDFQFVISADLGMTKDKIGQMLSFFLKRSLFDDKLFKADKILTSKGIQRRYQEAIKGRALKNPVQVEPKFWILEKNETQSFIKVRPFDGFSENNRSFSENNDSFSENNPHKVKESKVKESKVNCVCGSANEPVEKSVEKSVENTDNNTHAYGKYKNVFLTPDQYLQLCRIYGRNTTDEYADRISCYIKSNNKKPYSNHFDTMTAWLKKDKVREQSDRPSFDLDAYMEYAKNTPLSERMEHGNEKK